MRLIRIIPFLFLSLTALGQSSITVVTNVANLLALTPVTTRPVVAVLGQVTANDGLGRDVIWSAASSAATNTWAAGGPIARPWGSATGRWITLTNTFFPTPSTASGTSGTLSKFTGTSTLGNSIITESGTTDTFAGNIAFSLNTVPGLRLNNLTTVQRDATTPGAGSLIWNTTTARVNNYTGSAWTDGWVRLSGDTMTGALVNDIGTLTASSPNRIVQTWTNGAVAFNALEINITSTTNGSSTFIDCYDDGNRRFWVSNGGTVNSTQVILGNDAVLLRDSAHTVGQRNGANAQTYNLYGTTDAGLLNYRRLRTTMSTGGAVTVAAEGLGSGVSGNTYAVAVDGTTRLSIASTGVPTLTTDQLRLSTFKTPSSASDTGTAGTICYDANYIYICTAANTWKRVAIATW